MFKACGSMGAILAKRKKFIMIYTEERIAEEGEHRPWQCFGRYVCQILYA